MKLVFYDGELQDIQHYITTRFNGYFETLNARELKPYFSTIDAGEGIHNVLKYFYKFDAYTESTVEFRVVVTNSPDLLNKVDYKNIYLFKDGVVRPLQELTTRQLKPTHNIRKLYLSGEFNMDRAKVMNNRKNKYIASGWPYESINPEYPLTNSEEAENINVIATDHTTPYTSTDIPAHYYFVIHKLRKKEKYEEGDFVQFVTAVDEEDVAKDICDKYNKSAKYLGYKLVYEKVYLE